MIADQAIAGHNMHNSHTQPRSQPRDCLDLTQRGGSWCPHCYRLSDCTRCDTPEACRISPAEGLTILSLHIEVSLRGSMNRPSTRFLEKVLNVRINYGKGIVHDSQAQPRDQSLLQNVSHVLPCLQPRRPVSLGCKVVAHQASVKWCATRVKVGNVSTRTPQASIAAKRKPLARCLEWSTCCTVDEFGWCFPTFPGCSKQFYPSSLSTSCTLNAWIRSSSACCAMMRQNSSSVGKRGVRHLKLGWLEEIAVFNGMKEMMKYGNCLWLNSG